MNSNLLFSFLLPLQFAFTSKWHKSQRNPILKDTNSYLLYSICLRDKRRIGSLDYSSKWRTLKLLRTVVWRHTHQPVSQPGQAMIIYYLIRCGKKQTEPRAAVACEVITWCWHRDPGCEYSPSECRRTLVSNANECPANLMFKMG